MYISVRNNFESVTAKLTVIADKGVLIWIVSPGGLSIYMRIFTISWYYFQLALVVAVGATPLLTRIAWENFYYASGSLLNSLVCAKSVNNSYLKFISYKLGNL